MTKQNQNLFGDVIPEKDIKVKASLEANQGWVSFFYKTCRIGDAKYAVLAGHIIQFLQGEYRTALILNQLVGEDLHPIYYEKMFPRIATYLDLVSKKVCKKHNLWQNCYLLAKSPKWYMDNALPLDDSQVWNGKELEDIRQWINVKLGLTTEEKVADFVSRFEFPSWVWDRHTLRGYKEANKGSANLSLDGKWDNRYNIKAKFDDILSNNKGKTYDQILDQFHRSINL